MVRLMGMAKNFGVDRDVRPHLSSKVRHRVAALALGISSLALLAASLTSDQRSWYRTRFGLAPAEIGAQPPARGDSIAEAILSWERLRQSDAFRFEDYSAFLRAHRGWPGETALRRAAERALTPDTVSPATVVAHFRLLEPLSNSAALRFAEALWATGRHAEAEAMARKAWTGGTLTPADETLLLTKFGGVLRPEDHDARMDRLLWDQATTSAARQLGMTSMARRALFAARLALQQDAVDASSRLLAVWDANKYDAGLIVDRARWMHDAKDWQGARRLLAETTLPHGSARDPVKWMQLHLDFARAAANDRQFDLAYRIVDQTNPYPLGMSLRDRSDKERDVYTSIEWLAGWTAFRDLRRPADAIRHFQNYSASAQSPQAQSKGDYWAGRAAEAAGQAERARQMFLSAAAHPDYFYGQLALERLGQALAPPRTEGAAIPVTDRAQFENSEIVRAARLLGELGDWKRQSTFLRAIASSAESETQQRLAVELARDLARPDLGVQVARQARRNAGSWLWDAGYPTLRESAIPGNHWTLVHAITRQESQFDRQAVSHANARGLMQLMPGTARDTAGKMGLPYDYERLTDDPGYNISLGSTYIANMLDSFSGNYVLAVAAYNAGPGNVRKWIRDNGDPREPDVDVLAWIEEIPFLETRNYVQRVLENAVVYDWLHPARARTSGTYRLSAYLGRQSASLAASQ